MLRWWTLYWSESVMDHRAGGPWINGPCTVKSGILSAVSVFLVCSLTVNRSAANGSARATRPSSFNVLLCYRLGNQIMIHFRNLSKIRVYKLRYHFPFIQLVKNIKEWSIPVVPCWIGIVQKLLGWCKSNYDVCHYF